MNKIQIKNYIILFLAQLFTSATAPIVIFSGGVIADRMIENKSWITLPIATLVVGTALFAYYLAGLMRRRGRRYGFVLSNLLAQVGVALIILALIFNNFWIFCLSTIFLGANLSAMQQFRFAVVEGVNQKFHNRLISLLILSGLIGAILSLQFVNRLKDLFPIEFLGSYFFLGGFLFLALVCLLNYKNQIHPHPSPNIKSKKNLFYNPRFNFSFLIAMFGYISMSFIMTATPIYMQKYLKFSIEDSALVIQLHIAAMFLPSIFTGLLLDKLGMVNMIRLGIVFNFLAVVSNNLDNQFSNLIIGLLFLGVGWNFMFVSATVYLTHFFVGAERFKAQGINEVLVFGGQAFAAIFSGWFLYNLGWFNLNIFFSTSIINFINFQLFKKSKSIKSKPT